LRRFFCAFFTHIFGAVQAGNFCRVHSTRQAQHTSRDKGRTRGHQGRGATHITPHIFHAAAHDANARAILSAIPVSILHPILHRMRFPRMIHAKEIPIHIKTLSTKNARA